MCGQKIVFETLVWVDTLRDDATLLTAHCDDDGDDDDVLLARAGIAAKVLKSMGVTLKDARVEVEKVIGRGSGFVAVEIPFTPRAKRVLELSLEEARQLGISSRALAILASTASLP